MRKASKKSELSSESAQQSTTKNANQALVGTNNSPEARTGTKLVRNCHTENPKSTWYMITGTWYNYGSRVSRFGSSQLAQDVFNSKVIACVSQGERPA